MLAAFQHAVAITTKGALVELDLDLLGPMGQAGLVRVGVSMTTLDAGLSRALEPRAPSPARRLARALPARSASTRTRRGSSRSR